MKPNRKLMLILLIITATGLACGLLDIGVVEPGENLAEPTTPESTVSVAEPIDDSQPIEIEPTAHPNTQYWKYVEDPRFGVRLAVPCFWSANIPTPEQDPSGMASFPLQNFDEMYISRLGAKSGDAVWQYGGTKLDIGYLRPSTWNLSADASLEALAQAMYNNDDPNPETYLDTFQPVQYNGQEGLQVRTQSTTWGEGMFYLFSLEPDLVLIIGLVENAIGHPDTEAMLNSLALTPDVEVQIPTTRPTDPPIGMGAACLGIEESEIPPLQPATDDAPLTGTLDCTKVTEDDLLMWTTCNIQDSIISRNTQPLPGFMRDEFLVGYWQSEGVILNPFEATDFITRQMPTITGQMTFTIDEAQFPPLLGMEPEQMVNPDINIVEVVYSEGWGEDRQGAVLLFVAEDDTGYYFYGMVIAQSHFDK